ncbi:hypothetical protein BJX99DRAFT_231464 [Aspergillus californicus]
MMSQHLQCSSSNKRIVCTSKRSAAAKAVIIVIITVAAPSNGSCDRQIDRPVVHDSPHCESALESVWPYGPGFFFRSEFSCATRAFSVRFPDSFSRKYLARQRDLIRSSLI